ncbi:MAG: FAD-dependent oxidoreductase [Atopobiaceae bacterium]|nr:FAD-dependent oxidoreductase [Atopobiaceae bacterium]
MIEVSNIRIPLQQLDGTYESELGACRKAAAKRLQIRPGDIGHMELHRRSVDARKRSAIIIIFTVRLSVAGNESHIVQRAGKNARLIAHDESYALPTRLANAGGVRPVVVGAGCAGLFCALALASAGLEPLLVERGKAAPERTESVRHFVQTGELDPNSNIQFGLGGAGTFSDGKLGTGTKSPAHRLILQALVDAGAQRRILWDAKPHVGSDVLPDVVTAIARRIEELGGEVRFDTRLCGLDLADGRVRGVRLATRDTEEYVAATDVVLACGHSARDVFALLRSKGVMLERKTFAMGVRIEHLQASIDQALYGRSAGHPALGPAPYKLVEHLPGGRSVFSFCMCPGGYVVAATSEPHGVVTNGMSLSDRAGTNANAALLVNVFANDYRPDDVLAGIDLQMGVEKLAYMEGAENGVAYAAPAQLVGDFLNGSASSCPGTVEPTYPRGVTWGNSLELILPSYITESLRAALPRLERKIRGFCAADAVLTGVESRSSSPVRVTRTKEGMSVSTQGLWPCGEGAGYAGGIMSAATDGLNIAWALIRSRA